MLVQEFMKQHRPSVDPKNPYSSLVPEDLDESWQQKLALLLKGEAAMAFVEQLRDMHKKAYEENKALRDRKR
jgi:hypothetical protein